MLYYHQTCPLITGRMKAITWPGQLADKSLRILEETQAEFELKKMYPLVLVRMFPARY